jgi:hypothetical protein
MRKPKSGQTHAISAAVRHLLFIGCVGEPEFLAVLRTFGPLPEDGIRELAELLVGSIGVYRLQHWACLPVPAEQSKQLDNISKRARHLLNAMGIEDHEAVGKNPSVAVSRLHSTAQFWLPVALYKAALDRRPETATFTARERVVYLVALLSDLVLAADRSKAQVLEHSIRGEKRGRGGIGRKGPAPKGRLLHNLFSTYTNLRSKYPTSGPGPADRQSLIAFVRAGLTLAVSFPPPIVGPDDILCQRVEHRGRLDLLEQTTDDSIRGAFDRWVHNPNPKW